MAQKEDADSKALAEIAKTAVSSPAVWYVAAFFADFGAV